MKTRQVAMALVWLYCCAAWSSAQVRQRDPLTPVEVDELRNAAMDPSGRIKLFIRFARERLASLEQVRNDPKATDRGQLTHDRLQDFLDIYDELNDNIDNFIDRKEDMRKPLKAAIEADNEFQAKLLALKSAGDADPKTEDRYRFLLQSALDGVAAGVADHKQSLDEQEEAAKHRRKGKP